VRPAHPLALVVVRHPRFLDPWTSMSLVSRSMVTGLLAFAAHPRTPLSSLRNTDQPVRCVSDGQFAEPG
jgi:hypothetical protein